MHWVLIFLLFEFSLYSTQFSWGEVFTLSSDTTVDALYPKIEMDSSGNIVAVWIENGYVVSRTKSLNGNWSTPSTLSNTGASSALLSVSPLGTATALWIESNTIFTSTLPLNGSWGSAQSISGMGASAPALAGDDDGNIVAVWILSDAVEAAVKLSDNDWNAPVIISTTTADSPQVAIGGANTVMAVWHSVVDSVDAIYAARTHLGASWESPHVISNSLTNSSNPQVAVDSAGNGLAGWFRFSVQDSIYSQVVYQTASYVTAEGWSSPVDCSDSGYFNPSNLISFLAFDSSGNAFAAWTNSYDGSNYTIQSTIRKNSQWNLPPLTIYQSYFSFGFSVSITQAHMAVMAAMLFDGVSGVSIQGAVFDVDGNSSNSWAGIQKFSSLLVNGYPCISSSVVDNLQNMAVAWSAFNGSNNVINSIVGAATILQPPTSLTVTQYPLQFGNYTTYYNLLSWDLSVSADTVNYLIFRNGLNIATLPASASSYTDYNRSENEPVVYGMASRDGQGIQSEIVSIHFP